MLAVTTARKRYEQLAARVPDPEPVIVDDPLTLSVGECGVPRGRLRNCVRALYKGKRCSRFRGWGEERDRLRIVLCTNASQALFKQKNYAMSRVMASEAITLDRSNVKALYRRGIAARCSGDLEAAEADLTKALLHASTRGGNPAAIVKELKETSKAMSKKEAEFRELFPNGCSNMDLGHDRIDGCSLLSESLQLEKEELSRAVLDLIRENRTPTGKGGPVDDIKRNELLAWAKIRRVKAEKRSRLEMIFEEERIQGVLHKINEMNPTFFRLRVTQGLQTSTSGAAGSRHGRI